MFSGRLWNLFIDSFPKMFMHGLTVTIPLTVISFSLAMVIAIVVALVQFANIKVLKQICRFYIWIFRGTPLLVQLYIVFFGLSRIGILLDPFPAAVIVFSLNEGAYCAETVRASLESVPSGQLPDKTRLQEQLGRAGYRIQLHPSGEGERRREDNGHLHHRLCLARRQRGA